MNIEKKKIIYGFYILALILIVVYGIKNYSVNVNYFKFCAIIILFLNMYMAIRNRNNVMLYFAHIVILYFNYSFIYDIYITRWISLKVFYDKAGCGNLIFGKGIYMMLLFTTIIFSFDLLYDKKQKNVNKNIFFYNESKNLFLSYTLLIVAALTRISSSASLFEYSGVFVIIALLYCGGDKIFKNICLVYIVCLFIDLNLHGMRVPGLCFPIIAIFMILGDKVNYKHITVGLVLAIILMTYSGLYTDSNGNVTLSQAIHKLKIYGGALDTCMFSYLESEGAIRVADDFLSFSDRIDYFARFIKSQIVLSSSSIKFSKMCTITIQYFTHYNGQLFPHTFYFYLGWFGVVLSGLIVGGYLQIVKFVNEKSNKYVKIIAIWVVSMISKWYLYEPNALLKGALFLIIIYAIVNLLNKIMYVNYYKYKGKLKYNYSKY